MASVKRSDKALHAGSRQISWPLENSEQLPLSVDIKQEQTKNELTKKPHGPVALTNHRKLSTALEEELEKSPRRSPNVNSSSMKTFAAMTPESSDTDDDVNPFRKNKKKSCNESQNKQFLKYKMLKQANLVAIWIGMGLSIGLFGPCLLDLKTLLNINFEEIARAMIGVSVGAITGCILGGFLYEKLQRYADFMMGVSTLLTGLAITLIPFTGGIIGMFIVAALLGFASGAANSGGNTMVLNLWGSSSGPPMYSLHFGFGIGGMLAPQLARPFLMHHDSDDCHDSHDPDCSDQSVTSIAVPEVTSISRLFIPFAIVGALNVIIAVSMFAIFKKGAPAGFPKKQQATATENSTGFFQTCRTEAPVYSIVLLILLFFFYLNAVGGEIIFGKYIYSYIIESNIGLSDGQAATVTSLFWIGHVCGRGAGTLVSKFIPISFLIAGDLTCLIVLTLLLTIIYHPLVIWIGTPLLGFLVSPLFPAGMVWANNVLDMNSMSVMVCLLGGCLSGVVYMYITGYFFEYHGPRSLLHIEIFHACLLAVIFGLMVITGRLYQKRTGQTEKNSSGLKNMKHCENQDVIESPVYS